MSCRSAWRLLARGKGSGVWLLSRATLVGSEPGFGGASLALQRASPLCGPVRMSVLVPRGPARGVEAKIKFKFKGSIEYLVEGVVFISYVFFNSYMHLFGANVKCMDKGVVSSNYLFRDSIMCLSSTTLLLLLVRIMEEVKQREALISMQTKAALKFLPKVRAAVAEVMFSMDFWPIKDKFKLHFDFSWLPRLVAPWANNRSKAGSIKGGVVADGGVVAAIFFWVNVEALPISVTMELASARVADKGGLSISSRRAAVRPLPRYLGASVGPSQDLDAARAQCSFCLKQMV